MFQHAITAIQQGFWVFPCEPGQKTACLVEPGQPYKIKWPQYATNDLATAARYWQHWPDANVAIACKPSGLLVVDCDMPKTGSETDGTRFAHLMQQPGTPDGTDVLREICRQFDQPYEGLLKSYSVCTTHMGLQIYFRWPSGIKASQSSLLRGLLDIRCNAMNDGGYVMAAGSRTDAGPYTVETPGDVLDCPPFLVELCRDRPRKPVRPTRRDTSVFGHPLAGNIQGLADKVASETEGSGNRNFVLHWAACAAAEDRIPRDQALDSLGYAAQRAGLTEAEARATIYSAYRTHWKG